MHHLLKVSQKIDKTTTDNAKDLDLVMPMYSVIEYSSNYSKTKILWFYSTDEATTFDAGIANIDEFKIFKYKVKLLGNTVAYPTPNAVNGILTNAVIAVPLKYLSNLWRSLEKPLINCEV